MSPPASFKTLSYDLLDVFTLDPHRPFTGNPLAVVYGAREGLTKDQLQKVAREFNLSEITFPATPTEEDQAAGRYDVRIFTVDEELPFAGHPTLGTCFSLLSRSLLRPPTLDSPTITQHCPSGPVTLLCPDFTQGEGATLSLSSPHKYISPANLALPASFLQTYSLPASAEQDFGVVRTSSCGLPFLCVEVTREGVLGEMRSNGGGTREVLKEAAELDKGLQAAPAGVLVFFAEETGRNRHVVDVRVHARMLFTEPAEDPATGSANIALGPVLLKSKALGLPEDFSGTVNYTVSQGAEMGCPSLLRGRVTASNGKVAECWIGGGVVKVGEGWIRVPDAE